jgi:hypothetical protein
MLDTQDHAAAAAEVELREARIEQVMRVEYHKVGGVKEEAKVRLAENPQLFLAKNALFLVLEEKPLGDKLQ